MELSDKDQINKLLSKVEEKHKNSIDIDILDRQFSILNLPSQGHYYPDKTKSLLIRYLSAKEETVLTDELLMESGHALHLVLQKACWYVFFKNCFSQDGQTIILFIFVFLLFK